MRSVSGHSWGVYSPPNPGSCAVTEFILTAGSSTAGEAFIKILYDAIILDKKIISCKAGPIRVLWVLCGDARYGGLYATVRKDGGEVRVVLIMFEGREIPDEAIDAACNRFAHISAQGTAIEYL
jgi:hypothetical protein